MIAEETSIVIRSKAKQKKGNNYTYGSKRNIDGKAEKIGIEKGGHKKALEIAFELKKEGVALDFIVRITKLTLEEIEAL